MVRASKADVNVYEEVEADDSATSQALIVVVIAGVAAGIGAALAAGMDNDPATGAVGGFLAGVLGQIVGWAIWSWMTYFIGTKFMGGTASYGELLRTVGFSQSPGILGIIPFVGILVAFWMLYLGYVAVRQALDISGGKALAVILISFIPFLIVRGLLAAVLRF